MDEEDRNFIKAKLDNLTNVPFDDIFNQLKSKGMFNKFMEDEIMRVEEPRRLEYLFLYVTTRGPKAFKHLVEALKELNQNNLVSLLTNPLRPGRTRPFVNGFASSRPELEEEFPFEEEWIVTKGDPIKDRYDYDIEKVYKMTSSPRGLALIINIRKYVNDVCPLREGSEKDVIRLKSILPQLGYEVAVEEDLTANEIRDKVYEFSQIERHHLYDSALVFLMSHGEEKSDGSKNVWIAGSDAQYVNCYELVDILSARCCEALRGKPKVFFIQSCRGKNFNHTVSLNTKNRVNLENGTPSNMNHCNGDTVNGVGERPVQTDGLMMGMTDVVRSDSDIFIGHATSPGMLSMRDPDTGSWYIQTLCRVLARDAWCDDLYTMTQTVRRERNRHGLEDLVDIEDINQGFNKTVYFHPGICIEPSSLKTTSTS